MKIAVCDDESFFLESTAAAVRQWFSEKNLPLQLSCFDNGDSLISAATREKFDIIILDIIMPLLNGIDTAREIRRHDNAVKIIFLTSSEEFALDSYSVKA